MANKKERKPSGRPAKKRWRRPVIKSGQLFESNSLACSKNNPDMEQCQQGPAAS